MLKMYKKFKKTEFIINTHSFLILLLSTQKKIYKRIYLSSLILFHPVCVTIIKVLSRDDCKSKRNTSELSEPVIKYIPMGTSITRAIRSELNCDHKLITCERKAKCEQSLNRQS